LDKKERNLFISDQNLHTCECFLNKLLNQILTLFEFNVDTVK